MHATRKAAHYLRKGTPPDLSDFAGGRLQVELSTVIYTIVSRVHHRSSVIYSYLHIVSRVHHRSRVIYHCLPPSRQCAPSLQAVICSRLMEGRLLMRRPRAMPLCAQNCAFAPKIGRGLPLRGPMCFHAFFVIISFSGLSIGLGGFLLI